MSIFIRAILFHIYRQKIKKRYIDSDHFHRYTIRAMNVNLLKGLALLGVTSGYILGPLLLFGGIGWWLTDRYDNKAYVIAAIFIAFIVSNLLIITNTTKMMRHLKNHDS